MYNNLKFYFMEESYESLKMKVNAGRIGIKLSLLMSAQLFIYVIYIAGWNPFNLGHEMKMPFAIGYIVCYSFSVYLVYLRTKKDDEMEEMRIGLIRYMNYFIRVHEETLDKLEKEVEDLKNEKDKTKSLESDQPPQ